MAVNGRSDDLGRMFSNCFDAQCDAMKSRVVSVCPCVRVSVSCRDLEQDKSSVSRSEIYRLGTRVRAQSQSRGKSTAGYSSTNGGVRAGAEMKRR